MAKCINYFMKGKKGFTLLELMIVVIVIGILATLAIPRFNRAVEKGRQAEAFSNIGTLRLSEFRYRAEYAAFTSSLDILDIENPNGLIGRYFDYSVTTATDPTLSITATRNSTRRPSGIAAYTISIDQDGAITKSSDAP